MFVEDAKLCPRHLRNC